MCSSHLLNLAAQHSGSVNIFCELDSFFQYQIKMLTNEKH